MVDNGPNCVFCEIAAGRAPAYRVYEDALSFAILDINPYAQGHCLVLPRRHVQWWHEMTEEETTSLFNVARIVANRMMRVYKPDFVLTFTRGRRIPHTHIFLIPTYSGDLLDRFFDALEKVQESPQELARLRDASSMQKAEQLLSQD
ncbi:MAG: HIT family protein [Acidobacteriota bacterium]